MPGDTVTPHQKAACAADVAKSESNIAQTEAAKIASKAAAEVRTGKSTDLDQRAKTVKKPSKINTREKVAKEQKVPQKALRSALAIKKADEEVHGMVRAGTVSLSEGRKLI
jgi:hypothetical protein